MKNPSQRGYIFEHEVAEKLKKYGFAYVKVTKASRDYGADILAHKDGLEYVVQCKSYKGAVGYSAVKDISTAMEFYKADRGILICDTYFSKPAYKAVKIIDKPIELIRLEDIKSWQVRKLKLIRYRPHHFQKEVLNKLVKHRKEGNKAALLVMATGLGKTFVAAWDLKNQIKKGEKALFLVHRKDILTDNAEKFYGIINEKEEVFKFGIYFAGKRFDKEKDIVFSTFQTIIRYYNRIPKNYFDYIIIDEAHHSPSPTYSKVFSHFNPKFTLGITATPQRLTKADNDYINNVFGNPLVDLDLSESLIKGYLSPVKYSVFCDNINYTKLKSIDRKLSVEQLNKTYFIPTKEEDVESIIEAEKKKIKNPRTIIFCPTIKYINSVKSVGLYPDAAVYHSALSDFDRELIFRRFKIGKVNTLLVRDLLNEGIDIPDANLVIFLRTTYSPTVFLQQLGRGLRKAPNKKYLRVLDFVGTLGNIKKVINVFGHLLLIKDIVEKVEDRKKRLFACRGRVYRETGFLEPLDLDFYQAGKKVKHAESLYKKKDFLSEIKFLKKHLIKSEGWTEEEILNELMPICKRLGYFPQKSYLEENKRRDLIHAMYIHGGMYYFARKLGYGTFKKENKFWDNWENFKKEIIPICRRLKRVPSFVYLNSHNKGYLSAAMQKWGGSHVVAARLGYEVPEKPKGYWDDFSVLKKELLPICKQLKKMPTGQYLRKIKRNDIETTIYRWGGFHKVANRLGFKVKEKPKQYWLKFANLKKELIPLCKETKTMPSSNYLRKNRRFDLMKAINQWGGVSEVAKRLDYDTNQRSPGYWDEFKNIKKELLPICKKLGKMPSYTHLESVGKKDLAGAIRSKWKVSELANKLGYKSIQRPRGYWKNWRNLENELLPICKELHRMPTLTYLSKIGKGELTVPINKWGGTFSVGNKLGFVVKQKPKGYWQKWENLQKELIPICKRIGKMPSADYLKKIRRQDLMGAIAVNGGIRTIAKKLGYELKFKPSGHWNKWVNLKKELCPICKRLGKMPTNDYLRKIGKADLLTPIVKWGGSFKVARKLGYEAEERPKGYWDKWDNLKQELSPICKKLKKMPSSSYLKKLGKTSLLGAMITKWGGTFSVAKRLGYAPLQKEQGYWDSLINIKKELLPICKKLDRMPPEPYLRKIGRNDLVTAIRKWGGSFKVGTLLGYSVNKKPTGYWDKWETLESNLLPIYRKLKKMPTWDYLRKIGRADLASAITKWGGTHEVARKLSFNLK